MTVSLSELDARLRGTAIGRNILSFETGKVDPNFSLTSSETRPNSFYTWFNLQMKLFLSRGVSGFQLAAIGEKEDEVIKQALAMKFEADEIPFVLVPGSHLVSIPTLAAMIIGHDRIVTSAGPVGFTRLDPRKLSDCTDTPTPDSHSLLYAIFGVKNESVVGQQGRSFLTVREAMAVCVCTAILAREPVVAGNSYYDDRSGQMMPVLEMSEQGPELLSKPVDDEWSISKWLSCRGRL